MSDLKNTGLLLMSSYFIRFFKCICNPEECSVRFTDLSDWFPIMKVKDLNSFLTFISHLSQKGTPEYDECMAQNDTVKFKRWVQEKIEEYFEINYDCLNF